MREFPLRPRGPCGLGGIGLSGRRMATGQPYHNFSVRGRKAAGEGVSVSNYQLHYVGKGRHCPFAAIILCGLVDDEVASHRKRSVHGDLIASRENCPKFVRVALLNLATDQVGQDLVKSCWLCVCHG